MMVSWLILVFFAVVVLTSVYWIKEARDVDERGAFLERLGIRWPLHKVLPWFTLAIFALLLEDALQSGFWRRVVPVEPVLVPINQSVKPNPEEQAATLELRRALQRNDGTVDPIALARELLKQNRDTGELALSDVLAPEDAALILEHQTIRIPENSRWLSGFSVSEKMQSLQPVLASGWFTSFVWPGRQPAEYDVQTWCGFDLTVRPGERVCFSTLVMPIYHELRFSDCTAKPRTARGRNDAGGGSQSMEVDDCRPRLRMPRVFIKMTAEGVATLGYQPDAAMDSWESPRLYEDDATRAKGLWLGLAETRAGDGAGPAMPWTNYSGSDGTVALTLLPTAGRKAEGRALWSRRQIRDEPGNAADLWLDWKPFDGLNVDVPLPRAHLAAAEFLGHSFPWSDPAKTEAAIRDAWTEARIIDPEFLGFRCRITKRKRMLSPQSYEQLTGAPLAFRAGKIGAMPTRVTTSEGRCDGILPMMFTIADGML